MKGKLIIIGSGVTETGLGIVISAIWDNLLWLGFLLIGIGLLSMMLGLTWKFVIKCAEWVKQKNNMIFRVITHMNKSNEYLAIEDEQQKNPTKWLFPAIDHIDLNRQGGNSTKNDAFVRFCIDSHLLFPISEYYVFIKLRLRDESLSGFPEVEANTWHEIKQKGNYPPILQLERHRFAEEKIHFENGENELLTMMGEARKNRRVLVSLKVGIAFKVEAKNNPVCLEGSRWLAPMNDYRGG